jgi:ribonuclease HI
VLSIYTDGTPGSGGRVGGAAAVVCQGPPDSPEILQVLKWKGGSTSSVLEAEREGVRLAVCGIVEQTKETRPLLIITDSQALITELNNPTNTDDAQLTGIRELLDSIPLPVTVQWVPSHCGVVGNVRAEREATKASTETGRPREEGRSVPLCSAKAKIRSLITDPPISHPRTKLVYQGVRGKAVLSRKEAVTLAQLRSGHCRRLAAYRSVVEDGAPATCPRCGEAPEDLEHWLQRCPATAKERRNVFGVASPPLLVLYQDPVAVLAHVRSFWAV